MTYRFFHYRCWSKDFKQLALWPVIYFTKSSISESKSLYILSINVFVWDIGFEIANYKL
jgi:hypothetical protein